MRNLHLSQLRKATRTPLRAMSVVEFDTEDVGVWASDLGVGCECGTNWRRFAVCVPAEENVKGRVVTYPEILSRLLPALYQGGRYPDNFSDLLTTNFAFSRRSINSRVRSWS